MASVGLSATCRRSHYLADSVDRNDSFSARTQIGTFVQTKSATGGPTSGFYTTQGIEHTSLRASQLSALASQADCEQVAAQAIINVVKDQPKDHHYLAVAITPEAVVESGSSTMYCSQVPLLGLHSAKYIRRSDIGPAEALANPAKTSWTLSNSFLQRRTSTGNPNDYERSWSISLGAIGTAAMGLWLLWFAGALACRAMLALIGRRRRRHNLCIACGHALGPRRAA